MNKLNSINGIPYSEDILDAVGKDILSNYIHLLPDLHKVTIFLPNHQCQKLFYEKLINNAVHFGFKALVLPRCTTLREWAFTTCPPNKPLLSQYARELIFVDALKQQSSLFSNANPWVIANELLSLFDSMLLNNIEMPSINFLNTKTEASPQSIISQEAELVILLWEAWEQQLTFEHALDAICAYVNSIKNIEIHKDEIFYSVGIDDMSGCELSLFRKIESISAINVFVYANGSVTSNKTMRTIKTYANNFIYNEHYIENATCPYTRFIDAVFSEDELNIKQRANMFAKLYSASPAKSHLSIYKCNSFEKHVNAIDIKIRKWIYENKNKIAVISTDRKLVRRLRAVLEHANIKVNDLGGWALSTTSAAVVIECWLRLIENNYSSRDLLALLRSPFMPIKEDANMHHSAISLLENKIILANNIHSGLGNYIKALDNYNFTNRCDNEHIIVYLNQIIDGIVNATISITKLKNTKSIALDSFFEELLNSLKIFGFYTTLKKDNAGTQIIALLETQINNFNKIENQLEWLECRYFSAHILDQQNYKPPIINSCVTFCNLEQSRMLNFDAIVIASADKDHFPGSSTNYIFFNEGIRSELNIPTWRDSNALFLYRFRRLLEAAPIMFISAQTEQNDERISISPWIEAIETFHKFAYEDDLSDIEINFLVADKNNIVVNPQYIPVPSITTQPSPTLINELKPDSISISQYQQLINCPYQFFAQVCLNISKLDVMKEELNKAEFGSLVHQCIHAFFVNDSSLPGPFKEKVTTTNQSEAKAMLNSISENVFSDIGHGFSDELWLHRWQTLIPKFIKWEIQRQNTFTPIDHEISISKKLNDTISLSGRIDRIDTSNNGNAIIDYKTGQIPSRTSIFSGSHVQLPTYALLDKNCSQVEYVAIGKNNDVKTESVINNGELNELVSANKNRIDEFCNALNDDIQLTAHADDEICRWCDVRGLCRRDFWKL